MLDDWKLSEYKLIILYQTDTPIKRMLKSDVQAEVCKRQKVEEDYADLNVIYQKVVKHNKIIKAAVCKQVSKVRSLDHSYSNSQIRRQKRNVMSFVKGSVSLVAGKHFHPISVKFCDDSGKELELFFDDSKVNNKNHINIDEILLVRD